MVNYKKIILILAAIWSLSCWSVAKGEEKSLILANTDKAIQVERKQPYFTVRFEANPTTGFIWMLEKLDADLSVEKHSYIPSHSGMVGAGGYEEWTFKVKSGGFVAPRRMSIKMVYARPWEVETAKQIKLVITTN